VAFDSAAWRDLGGGHSSPGLLEFLAVGPHLPEMPLPDDGEGLKVRAAEPPAVLAVEALLHVRVLLEHRLLGGRAEGIVGHGGGQRFTALLLGGHAGLAADDALLKRCKQHCLL